VQAATALVPALQSAGALLVDCDLVDHASANPLTRVARDGSLWDLDSPQWEQLRDAHLITSEGS
jgi:hypothetical protein